MSTQTLEPTKSHYTNSSAPAVVQTLSGQCHSALNVLQAYFGFTLPAKPANETLTQVQMKVVSTTSGGSVGTVTYSTCSDVWDEATLCWNNQPSAVTGLGTIVNPVTVSTLYSFNSSTLAPFVAAAGGPISIMSTCDNADSFVVWARSNATPSNRPNLVLTFTPNTTLAYDFDTLRTAGYTGSLVEMRRQNLLALLSLTEPQNLSNADLEFQYLRSIGKTGSIMDMRKQLP